MKQVMIKIDACAKCPYCFVDYEFTPSYDSPMITCTKAGKALGGTTKIPTWCPLPEVTE